VLAHMATHPRKTDTPMADALLDMYSDDLHWLSDFDALLLRTQEQRELSGRDHERRAHLLHARLRSKVKDRKHANIRPCSTGALLYTTF